MKMVSRSIALAQGNKNAFLFILYFIMFLVVVWGWLLGVRGAEIYGIILAMGGVLLSTILLWVDEENKTTMKEYFKSPFAVSAKAGIGMWVFGILTVFLVAGFGALFSFSTFNVAGSFYFSQTDVNMQQLSASSSADAGIVQTDKFSEFFYSVFVAGVLEEIIFAYILFLAGWLIAMGLASLFPALKNYWFYMLFAQLIVISTFMYAHTLNGSYLTLSMFIVAGIFRLMMNAGIYIFGLTLSYTVGFHQANNLLAFIQINGGFANFLQILVFDINNAFNWFGVGILLFVIGVFIYALANAGEIMNALVEEVKSFNR